MSGHSKWHSIKHKKGAADAKRGKIFTRHAKLIALAAQGGGDPDMNPALRTAIDNAKADNTPNANIDRAIKKGTGADKDGVQIEELMYEGYGPAGTAILVQCLTDNKNRTVANVKHIFSKHGGNLATNGAVAWMFERKGILTVEIGNHDKDELELEAIDAGANDTRFEEDILNVYTIDTELGSVKDALKAKGIEVKSAKLTYESKNDVKVETADDAKKVLKLMNALDDDDDMADVFSNFDISEEILESLA